MNRRFNHSTAAASRTTTTGWLAAAIFLVLAACSDDPQTPSEHQNELIETLNADRVTCTTWPVADCANICDPKPMNAPPPGSPECATAFVVVAEGVPGYCSVRFAPDRVDWLPCGVQ